MPATNTLLTIDMITKESLRVLSNNLNFTKTVLHEYDDSFAKSGAKIGDTLRIRKPAKYTVRSGATASPQNHTETYVNLAVNNQRGIDLEFSSVDMTLKLDEFSDRVIKPAMSTLSNEIDKDGLALYWMVANQVGAAGTTPGTALVFLQAGQRMDEEATPRDDQRYVALSPAAQAATVDGLKGLFQSSTAISEQYMKGEMGTALGFNFYMTQNTPVHTVGALGGAPAVDGATQTGATLNTKAWTSAAAPRVKKGDVFTVTSGANSVEAVNPVTRQTTGSKRQFAVQADGSSTAGGLIANMPIFPSIITSGAFQTVTASPSDSATLGFVGTAATAYPICLAYHHDAFAFACADMELSPGLPPGAKSRQASRELGLSIRLQAYYDGANDINSWRFDVLYGWQCVRPELACRIIG